MSKNPIERLPVWTPVVYAFFVAVPFCTATLGTIANLPLAAIALCLPLVAIIGWFFGVRGVLLITALAAFGFYIPTLVMGKATPDWGPILTCAIVALAFAWMGSTLRNVVDAAYVIAGTDSLTEINNRNRFLENLAIEANRALRKDECLCVAYLDVDNFKTMNDQYGHLVGDALLIETARVLRRSVRSYDVVARMGGDEFALLLLDANLDTCETVVKRVQQNLNQCAKEHNWDVSWSIGVSVFPEPFDPKEMLHAADQLMYSVKRSEKGTLLIKQHENPEGTKRLKQGWAT